ncbi:MAG: hypothetical protein AABW52_04220 [Nanoarchaeota archaeon]
MKVGDSYVNYGGETVLVEYVPASAYINTTTKLIVRGFDTTDANKTLAAMADEFRSMTQPEIIIHSKKLLEQRLAQ